MTLARFGLVALLLMGFGCVSVQVQPILPFPPTPEVTFTACQPRTVCLSDQDGNKVRKWMDELNAYQRALQRTITP